MFIQQFIQLGLLEIDYIDHYHLRSPRAGEPCCAANAPCGW
jgi:hypothetical protein